MSTRLLFSAALAASIVACAPARTTAVTYPGQPAAFDRAGSDPQAVAIADKVFAAAGGDHWAKVQQLRWKQAISTNGTVDVSGEQAWDRWNGRHWAMLHRDSGDVGVGYDLYGTHVAGYTQHGDHAKSALDGDSRAHALEIAKNHFNADTARMAMQFLMLEPGAKLTYGGKTGDDKGDDAADDVTVVFSDPARKGTTVHAIVDRATNEIVRVEMIDDAKVKTGFIITKWTDVDGMKFATSFKDLGSPHTIEITDLKSTAPDDDLFIAPVGG